MAHTDSCSSECFSITSLFLPAVSHFSGPTLKHRPNILSTHLQKKLKKLSLLYLKWYEDKLRQFFFFYDIRFYPLRYKQVITRSQSLLRKTKLYYMGSGELEERRNKTISTVANSKSTIKLPHHWRSLHQCVSGYGNCYGERLSMAGAKYTTSCLASQGQALTLQALRRCLCAP